MERVAAFEKRRESVPGRQTTSPRKGSGDPPAGSHAAPLPERILRRLRQRVGSAACDRYFGRQASIEAGSGGVRVAVASRFVADVIDRRFKEEIRRAASEEMGREVGALEIVVEPGRFVEAPAPAAKPARPARPAREQTMRARRAPRRYSLDEFVVGASNELAYNAACSVAGGDASITPLFIHGSCGLGKTHLLQGIAARYREAHPGSEVRYTTAESFTNAFLTAMRGGTLDEFRRSYRSVDLLCLDDVHFLGGKRATQTELLHTFDAVDMGARQVVLASDEHPRDIDRLNAALVSRFLAGAVVRLEAPDEALRLRIARALAQKRGLVVEDSALGMIAERCVQLAALTGQPPSVRDLEGMVIQIEAAHRLLPDLAGGGGRVGAVLASKALGIQPGVAAAGAVRRPVRVERIMQTVCESLGVSPQEFCGHGRHRRFVLARALTVLLARERTNLSYPEIARAMGRPNHSTVITAHRRIEKQIKEGEMVGIYPEFDGVTLAGLAERYRRELARDPRGA